MHLRMRAVIIAIVVAAAATACNGRSGPLGPEYEYEEDLTLRLDGSATLVVNASIPALIALRGLPLNPEPRARGDQLKAQVQGFYASPNTKVGRISMWSRHGRRYVGIHLTVADIRALPAMQPFSWATYDLHEQGDIFVFRETLSRIGTRLANPPDAGWQGNEIVAFRLHLPARIRYHNSRDLQTNEPLSPARGNILTWEQRMQDRMAGKPIAYAEDKTPDVMEVRMDRESILYRTLWLFALAFLAAVLAIGGLIWFAMRRGPADPESSPPPHGS